VKTIEIRDMWASAYLIARGNRLVRVIPGEWVHFEFDNEDGQASRALGEWGSGAAMVRAKVYAGAVRQVRRLIHS
jgi:hypothetical protein